MIRALVANAPGPARASLVDALATGGVLSDERTCAASHLLDVLRGHPYDALLVSLELPGLSRSTWRALVSAADPAPILVILDSATECALIDALWAGVRGAVLRGHPERAPAAVRAAVAGDVALPRGTTRLLVSTVIRQQQLIFGDGPTGQLTERERQVYELMQGGRSTLEIAETLVVAPVTVRSHVASILRKLGVDDRQAAIDLAGRQPLVR